MTPQEEATQLFHEVTTALLSSGTDLPSLLRKCQFACQLVGWDEAGTWFRNELSGFAAADEAPQHRYISGHARWRVQGMDTAMEVALHDVQYGGESFDKQEQTVTRVAFGPIVSVIAASQAGWESAPIEVKHEWVRRQEVRLERIEQFPAYSYQQVVSSVERMTFDFASSRYQLLKYGNTLADMWQENRQRVEAALNQLGLTQHLEAIQHGLASGNPEQWRAAVYGCRSLLTDLADALWRDPRPEYECLPGDTGRNLDVTHEKSSNRLSAYLHQKGLSGRTGKLLRDEMERLSVSLRSLLAAEGAAHAPVSREDARLIAIDTYMLLGQLAARTDMQPIKRYGPPATADS